MPPKSASPKTPKAKVQPTAPPKAAPPTTPTPALNHVALDVTPPWIPFLLICVPALHILVAPYTKVEESFTLHAVHDVLRYGLNPSGWNMWDHRTFPGAVPRSFLPPIALAIATMPTAVATNIAGITATGVDVQQLVRLTLSCFWAFSMIQLSRSIQLRFGRLTSAFFVLFSIAQFHIPFYAGRTLPNFMALPFVILSFSYTLREEYWRAVACLTATATVIRLELALMVVPFAINLVILKRISLLDALTAGIAGGFGSLAIAAPIDYFLWAPTLPHASLPDFTPLHGAWPELSAMIYNIVDGKADDWGVMPKTFYVSALAKMLLGAFPLANIACMWAAIQGLSKVSPVYENKNLTRNVGEVVRLLGPGATILVAALTNVGHKEWRFIVYVVPILNILAAAGAAALWSLPSKSLQVVARMAVLGLLALTVAFTVFSSYVSSLNYPGGDVWSTLEKLDIPNNATIHFPSYPLQTGSSLFTFIHAPLPGSMAFPHNLRPWWNYSKDENPSLLDPQGAYDAKIDYVVTPDWAAFTDAKLNLWKEVAAIDAFDGVKRGGKYFLEPTTAKKLAVLQRVD